MRLSGFDYSMPGAYFITLCAYKRQPLFGSVSRGEMVLSAAGKIVWDSWNALPDHYQNVRLDEFIVMPDHAQGVLFLHFGPDPRAGHRPAPTFPIHSLSEIVRGLKTFSAKKINVHLETPGRTIWQRGFHDKIIKNEVQLDHIRKYVRDNPKNWKSNGNVGAGL